AIQLCFHLYAKDTPVASRACIRCSTYCCISTSAPILPPMKANACHFFSQASEGLMSENGSRSNKGTTRRTVLKGLAAVPAISLAPGLFTASAAAEVNSTGLAITDTTVKVGILHSVTGTMAISETGSVEAEKLAISQINEAGGILGRKIEFIQEDGASDWP